MRSGLLIAAILALAGCTSTAIGQDNLGAAARGATCALIEDSLRRLTCFDGAFPRGVAPDDDTLSPTDQTADAPTAAPKVTAPPPSPMGKWTVTREKSAIDDSPTVLGYLQPNEEQSGGLFVKGLLIRCRENTTSVIVATDDFQIGQDTGEIIYRFDDEPALSERWGLSDKGSALGLWSGAGAIPFLKRLRSTETLAVRTLLQKQIDMTYDVRGAAAIIDEIAAACNWPVE